MGARGWRTVIVAGHDVQSIEGVPPSPLETLARDARWCGGDIMAFWVVGLGPGLRICNRWILALGVLGYGISVPLWMWIGWSLIASLTGPFLGSWWEIEEYGAICFTPRETWSLVLLLIFLILAPKIIGLVVALNNRTHRAGAWFVGELVASAILAPTLSIHHAWFWVHSLFYPVSWASQNRGRTEGTLRSLATDLRLSLAVGSCLVMVQLAFPHTRSVPGIFVGVALLISPWAVSLVNRSWYLHRRR